MSRSVDEWIGKNDDTAIPTRVRIRVFDAAHGQCHCCGRKISAGEYWQADHIIALINGGANAESNLRPACRNCCYTKTAEDQAEKSVVAAKRKGHALPRQKPKSLWKRKVDGTVVRR